MLDTRYEVLHEENGHELQSRRLIEFQSLLVLSGNAAQVVEQLPIRMFHPVHPARWLGLLCLRSFAKSFLIHSGLLPCFCLASACVLAFTLP